LIFEVGTRIENDFLLRLRHFRGKQA
jgi:hypothetical protein